MSTASRTWTRMASGVVAFLILSELPAIGGASSTTWTISGTVTTHGGLFVVGANVTIVRAPCPVLANANNYQRCEYVASGSTDNRGEYTITVPAANASYWVYSHPAGGFGGDYRYLGSISGPVSGINLTVWPYRGYGNATIVLPQYNLLSSYACNGQALSGCGPAHQVPILSWLADGAIYVNASNDLVFYSFPNQTTRVLSSSWVPLHQNFMRYGGVENTQWVTADGSYVYTTGCTATCTTTSSLEFEAVNVSTGTRVTHTWNVTVQQTGTNGQADMVGIDGAAADAALIDQFGWIHLWNLSNQTEWRSGPLEYFEANNVYWVPELNSYIDVSAGGSDIDRVAQYRFNGTSFHRVFSGSWGSGKTSNWVNGLVYNLTAHQIYFEAGSYAGSQIVTDVLTVGTNRTIVSSSPLPTYPNPTWPERKWGQVTPNSPEHRIAATPWGPTIASDYSALFLNSSWLQDTTTRTWFDTNQSMDDAGSGADNAPETTDAQFYNGSYSIDPASLYCLGTGNKNWSPGVCPLEGTFPNTTLGTIWWFWQVGQPRFPFPTDSPLAEPNPPAAPSVQVESVGPTSITINWTLPSSGEGPLLNTTVFWGTSPGNYTGSSSLVPWAHSYTLTGLETGTTYHLAVQLLNHHGFGPRGRTNGTPVGEARPPLRGPTALAVRSFGPQPTLAWTNPPGPIVNDTVYWGASCSAWTHTLSLGGPAGSVTLLGLPNGTTQWFSVAAWDAARRSVLSNCVSDAPPPPRISYASLVNDTTIELSLSDNVAPVFNHTIRYGPWSCSGFPYSRSTNGGVGWVLLSGLEPSAGYCLEVASWSYGGESDWSPPVVVSAVGSLPGPPTGIAVVPGESGAVVIDWTNPWGAVVSDTVLWGGSCDRLSRSQQTSGPQTSLALTEVPNGTLSWFEVVASGRSGFSPPSACANDATPAPSIVSSSASVTGAVVVVLADAGEPVFNHTFRYTAGPCGANARSFTTGNGDARTELVGLSPGTAYCLQASSWSYGGASTWSVPVTFDTSPAAPATPTNLRVVAVGPSSVSVRWSAPAGPVSGTTVWVGRGCDGQEPWLAVDGNASGASVGGLSAATSYCLSVQSWAGSLSSNRSGPAVAWTSSFGGSVPAISAPDPLDRPTLTLLAVALAGVGVFAALTLRPRPASTTARRPSPPPVGCAGRQTARPGRKPPPR